MKNTSKLLDAIQMYFDAIYECDVNLLDRVFHESSSLFDGDSGRVFVEPIASFRADVGGRQSPASQNQKREEEIILIDYLSQNCATVKIRLRAHTNIFVDHLCFVKGARGWEIVSKIWHMERVVSP